MKPTQTKPQLHQSHLVTLSRCGEKFKRKYILGHKEPNTTALIVGSTSHDTAAENLNNKIKSGELLKESVLLDVARDKFEKNWNETPVMLRKEEESAGLSKTKGAAIDESIALAKIHHTELAPNISPVAVEQEWVLQSPSPYDIAGTIDVKEQIIIPESDGSPEKTVNIIRELKNLNRNPGERFAHGSDQASFYALAEKIITGKLPDEIWFDILVKTKTPYLVSYKTHRDPQDLIVVKARFDRAVDVIKAGNFMPASRSDWWCGTDFCGFAADGSCPFFNKNPKNFFINENKKPEKEKRTNGNTKPVQRIKTTNPLWRSAESTDTNQPGLNNADNREIARVGGDSGGGDRESRDSGGVFDGSQIPA